MKDLFKKVAPENSKVLTRPNDPVDAPAKTPTSSYNIQEI